MKLTKWQFVVEASASTANSQGKTNYAGPEASGEKLKQLSGVGARQENTARYPSGNLGRRRQESCEKRAIWTDMSRALPQ